MVGWFPVQIQLSDFQIKVCVRGRFTNLPDFSCVVFVRSDDSKFNP